MVPHMPLFPFSPPVSSNRVLFASKPIAAATWRSRSRYQPKSAFLAFVSARDRALNKIWRPENAVVCGNIVLLEMFRE